MSLEQSEGNQKEQLTQSTTERVIATREVGQGLAFTKETLDVINDTLGGVLKTERSGDDYIWRTPDTSFELGFEYEIIPKIGYQRSRLFYTGQRGSTHIRSSVSMMNFTQIAVDDQNHGVIFRIDSPTDAASFTIYRDGSASYQSRHKPKITRGD